MLNYRCLVLDHDDTVVRSEETVNYPSFLEALKVLRPGRTITREKFTRWCFSPGFFALCSDYIGLTPEEIESLNVLTEKIIHQCKDMGARGERKHGRHYRHAAAASSVRHVPDAFSDNGLPGAIIFLKDYS